MVQKEHSTPYPRNHLPRLIFKALGKLLLPALFNLEISGRDTYPDQGPLIVVGNHTAAMEAVLMNVYTPWQIEMLSAADMPAEGVTEFLNKHYGVIPLNRGSYDRSALRKALSVLEQNGILGLFPEGGIWEEGEMRAQPGVAWLSYRGGAPVLPIGFNDTTGAVNRALELKRPKLEMHVGEIIPPVEITDRTSKKDELQEYADRVMAAVRKLIPDRDRLEKTIRDERFSLELQVRTADGEPEDIPSHLDIEHSQALAKFLHRPAILKIFRENLELDVGPLEDLAGKPSAREIIRSLDKVLTYLNEENPYLLTYRFGPREGHQMKLGLEELLALARWIDRETLRSEIIPIRRYFSPTEGQEIEQRQQKTVQSWM